MFYSESFVKKLQWFTSANGSDLEKNCENSIVQFPRISTLEEIFRFLKFFSCARVTYLNKKSPKCQPKDSARDW